MRRPLGFKLSVVSSDRLTEVFLFSPGNEKPWAFEVRRRSPLSVVISIKEERAAAGAAAGAAAAAAAAAGGERSLQVSTSEAVGVWRILLNPTTKDVPVSIQLTAAFGGLVDGSIRVYRHPNLQTLQSDAQHITPGSVVSSDISADPNSPNHRKIFIFPLDFNVQTGQALGFRV